MRPGTRRELVPGSAGRIECAVDAPQGEPRGVALVAHPHPLYGGTLDNKVVQTLARALLELGYESWRPNFRGVGDSAGAFDEGRGEVEDLATVLAHAQARAGAAPPILAGFSFGAALQARLAARVKGARVVLVGIAVNHFEAPAVPPGSLVIHGEKDDTVPLAEVLAWAEPQELPVVVLPGADHFFHRRLHLLRALVRHHLR